MKLTVVHLKCVASGKEKQMKISSHFILSNARKSQGI